MNIKEKVEWAVEDLELAVSDDFYGMCCNCGRLLSFTELLNFYGTLDLSEINCLQCGGDVSRTWDFNLVFWENSYGGADPFYPVVLLPYGCILNLRDFSIDTFRKVAFADGCECALSDEAAAFLEREIDKEYGGYIRQLMLIRNQ